MKIIMEVDDSLIDHEVVIRCKEVSDEILFLQKQITEIVSSKMKLQVSKGETDFYLKLDEILFLETADNYLAVHTANQIYESKQRLYELEGILPGNFMRVSKSTILNVGKVRAIHKNITGASEIEFANTTKKTYASRNYIKELIHKLEERRLS